MEFKELELRGAFEIIYKRIGDARGSFTKLFHFDLFRDSNLVTDFREQYVSVSAKDVIRGLHFQVPPMDHAKIVTCLSGRVLDVVVDIRKDSGTYGQFKMLELSSEKNNGIYIPSGFAHGFCSLEENSTLLYTVSSVHSAAHDKGILWNSLPVPWPTNSPILSDRDKGFLQFEKFESPF